MIDNLVTRLRKMHGPNVREAADKIEQLELEIGRLLINASLDARLLADYHKWCEMNGCAPASSDLITARAALGEKKDD